jgi:hypothetical protein
MLRVGYWGLYELALESVERAHEAPYNAFRMVQVHFEQDWNKSRTTNPND